MKATDLMIGDWVNYRPGWINEENGQIEYESGTGFPVKIDFIYKATGGEGLVQYNDGENNGMEAAEYELFPIPLTSEILEKNGFTKENRLYYWTQEKDGKTIAGVYYWVDEKHINIAGYEDDGVTISCHYVHELQHALKLCGINKEIEL